MIQKKLNKFAKFQEGFTLIELLIVIGILAVLLAITLIAINPARQFGQANNTKRQSAATQILNAVGAYVADHQGQLPPQITTTMTQIASTASGIDICSSLVTNYIPALPVNPSYIGTADITNCANPCTTGYSVMKDAHNRVTVTSLYNDNTSTIQVTR